MMPSYVSLCGCVFVEAPQGRREGVIGPFFGREGVISKKNGREGVIEKIGRDA